MKWAAYRQWLKKPTTTTAGHFLFGGCESLHHWPLADEMMNALVGKHARPAARRVIILIIAKERNSSGHMQ